jgi:hypothetical protein
LEDGKLSIKENEPKGCAKALPVIETVLEGDHESPQEKESKPSLNEAQQEQAELDAAKNDNAEVPAYLWDQQALRLPEGELPSNDQIKALWLLQKCCLQFWKQTTVKNLCQVVQDWSRMVLGLVELKTSVGQGFLSGL